MNTYSLRPKRWSLLSRIEVDPCLCGHFVHLSWCPQRVEARPEWVRRAQEGRLPPKSYR